MKRARGLSFTEANFRFSIRTLPPRTTAVVRALSAGDGDEEYVVHFRPPLARKDARRVHLSVVYCGDRIQEKPLLFSARLLGDAPGVPYSLGDDLRYELFETHQLRLYGDTIGSAYLAFEDNLTTPNYDTHARYELRVDLTLHLMPRLIPGQFLMWFPPDVDPQAWGLRVDPTLIPQRSPLWFKLRGAVSGTKAYSLLGFWVPRPGSAEARDYNFFDKGTFSPFARAAMRLGSLSEERALLAYFSHYPARHYQEMGWCPAPPGYPAGWGASPDGLLVDRDMTWERVPKQTAKFRALDVTRGVCEIKTSRTKCDMAAYFIPQVREIPRGRIPGEHPY